MRRLFFGILLCLNAVSINAQNAEADLNKVLELLLHSPDLYFENKYMYFEPGAKVPAETILGEFHRSGTQEYAKMGDVEVLKVGDLMIAVDHEEHLISTQTDAVPGSLNGFFDATNILNALETRELKVTYAYDHNGMNALLLIDPEKPNNKCIIRFDPLLRTIKEVSLISNDPFGNPWEKDNNRQVTVVIQYFNYTSIPKEFAYRMDQFVKKQGNKYTPSGKCKGYRVM